MGIVNLVQAFDAQYFEKLNLVASENVSSANVRYALQSDLNHRYAIPPEGQRDPAIWDYPNQSTIHKIIAETEDIACELFHAKKADTSPLSGNQIAAIMLSSLLEQGDTFLSVGPKCGGHFTTEKLAQERGYNRIDLPYDLDVGSIDVEQTADIVAQTGAKLIFLDASMILFPYPVRELREALGDDVIISYDASHTLGMIAGKAFQSPLEEGADFLHGSTHKSLWGPQKGIILSAQSPENSKIAAKVFSSIVPLFVSNAHPHHIAALGIALEESRDYGAQFAQNTVRNARILGDTLKKHGVEVCFPERGYTECHQIIVKIGTKAEGQDAFRKLESANINVNAISVPFSSSDEYGLRIGLSEITRRGIVGEETLKIGTLIADAIQNKRPIEEIRNDVIHISRAHKDIHYTNSETTIVPQQPSLVRHPKI